RRAAGGVARAGAAERRAVPAGPLHVGRPEPRSALSLADRADARGDRRPPARPAAAGARAARPSWCGVRDERERRRRPRSAPRRGRARRDSRRVRAAGCRVDGDRSHRPGAARAPGGRPSPAVASRGMPLAQETFAHLKTAGLADVDPEIAALLTRELERERGEIELIASENFTWPSVFEAVGSVPTNKYAEGYPGRRYYGGCEVVDEIEQLAIDRAKELFGAEH